MLDDQFPGYGACPEQVDAIREKRSVNLLMASPWIRPDFLT